MINDVSLGQFNYWTVLWGGTPRKIGLGCAAHFPKPLPFFWFCDFPYPIYDLTKNLISYYEFCSWHSCPNHNYYLWRAFVDGLIENDEKVASSKRDTQFKTRVQKPCLISDQNGQTWYPIYDQNGWKTIPFGAAHTYIAYIREYTPPPMNCQPVTACPLPLHSSGLYYKAWGVAGIEILAALCGKT